MGCEETDDLERRRLEERNRVHVEMATGTCIVGLAGAGSPLVIDDVAGALNDLPEQDLGALPPSEAMIQEILDLLHDAAKSPYGWVGAARGAPQRPQHRVVATRPAHVREPLEALRVVGGTRDGHRASASRALALQEPRGDVVVLERCPDDENGGAAAHALVRGYAALVDQCGRGGCGVTHRPLRA